MTFVNDEENLCESAAAARATDDGILRADHYRRAQLSRDHQGNLRTLRHGKRRSQSRGLRALVPTLLTSRNDVLLCSL